MNEYPIVACRNIVRKVGLTTVYICGILHRPYYVVYAVPGDWTGHALAWCDSYERALVEIAVNGYELIRDDCTDFTWIRN